MISANSEIMHAILCLGMMHGMRRPEQGRWQAHAVFHTDNVVSAQAVVTNIGERHYIGLKLL
jgi:hypothetical protein